jgi:glutamyl-tRNA reductase
MAVWALGINHTTAPLDLRGRFAIAAHDLPPTLDKLKSALGQQAETTIISTCNRTELYCAGEGIEVAQGLDWLAANGGVSVYELQNHAYIKHADQAAQHVFRVAAGLDSMVLGEAQILGQLKDAVRAAEDAGAMGATLHQLFQRAFNVAKEVRSDTEIGEHSISMSAAAVRLAGQLFDDLSRSKVLLVGAGEMIDLTATHFAARRPAQMVIANRTMERGQALAHKFALDGINTSVMRLADIPLRLHEFDVVVSCTASTLPIIGLGAVERALRARRHRPVFMLDLAVPRDIELEVKALDDVYLYTVDDLASVVQTGQAQRLAAVSKAEAIVSRRVDEFMLWLASRQSGQVDLIQQINAQAENWRNTELEKAQRLLDKGESAEQVMQQLSRSLTQKMLHGAYHYLRTADEGERQARQATLGNIFLKRD